MSENTFKILLTTDNHLGFAERDPRRGDDSFTTFEEVLRAARTEHDVDAMLLGGDLFHENKPSLGCLVRACSLFRKYVFGNKAVPFSLLSDPAQNFPSHALPMANFQDPNINLALPVFAIHGNHDDPVGGTSSLDLLATNGYINYFGHVTSLDDIILEPVLLRKGSTFIALYGLGNVRDERLHRCFRLKKVQFVYPKPVPGRKWFNILLLHQNRGVRGVGSKNGIMEGMLAGFGMDLVIWGNEHEQLMVPQPADGFDVVQPGSTIMTSLSAQECNPKQYGILEVRGTSYRLTPYTLRSVRPVVRRTVALRQDLPDGRTLDAVETFLHSVMNDMIGEAEEQISHIPDDVLTFHPNLKYPLILLAVDFTDVTSAPYPQPNFNRFGQQYIDVVANPGELLRPVKPKLERRMGAATLGTVLGSDSAAASSGLIVPTGPQLHTLDIRVRIADVFNHNLKKACTLLSEAELSAAVYAFAEKGERNAIDERLMELLHTSQKSVWRRLENGANDSILTPDRVVEEVFTHKRHVNERYARAAQLEGAQQQQQQQQNDDAEENEHDDVAGERRDRGGAASPSLHPLECRHQLDDFDMVRVTAPRAAPNTGDKGCIENENRSSGRFGLTSVSGLIQRAIEQGNEGGANASGGAPGRRAPQRRGVVVEADTDDDTEELPDDGLGRMPIDSIVAQAVQQVHPPSKRTRSAHISDVEALAMQHDESTCRVGSVGPHDGGAIHVVDADDGVGDDHNTGGVLSRHSHARMEAGDSAQTAGPAKRQQRTNSARRRTSSSTTSRRAAPSAPNAASLNAAPGTASGVGPSLTLVAHKGTSTALSFGNIPAFHSDGGRAQGVSSATVAPGSVVGTSRGAMLNVLSKWTDGSAPQSKPHT